MARLIMQVGETYGGMRIVAMTPGEELITVECLKCGEQVKRNRSNIRSKRILSCGRYSCKAKAISINFQRLK